ncbi:hypothetical protein E3T46_17360 [Cryobacterium sp. Hh11]|uniref:hypothetical protein n=1 Tax=Cryobacterium sp. Hh11 TaxID=2555868 RepID=UPI00106B5A44|nr:hypothetical protein [Cryobacterium sp. Hh11]TFD47564.1 hypothetical protein E3T46_17360 [Cryobacterium sp. Hh11]
MTNTIEQVIAYARAHPTRGGGTWHNWCESFVYRAGGFSQSFSTATLAGNAAGWLNPSPLSAPRGAIHYWGNGPGHVAFELGGGLMLMASDGATSLWGTALGTATLAEYSKRKPSMRYRGWSLRHGTQTLAASAAPAATHSAPIPTRKKKSMYLAWDTNGTGYLVTDQGWFGLPSMQYYDLFKRLLNSTADAPQTFNKLETDMMNNVLRGLSLNNNTQAAAPTIDAGAIAKVVAEAVRSQIGDVNVTIDEAAIAKAVNDDAAARLAS